MAETRLLISTAKPTKKPLLKHLKKHIAYVVVRSTSVFPHLRTSVGVSHLRTSVGRFCSCLYKWGMATAAACECGAEQTVDHVILHCPIHRPPHGLHGLTVLDDETT